MCRIVVFIALVLSLGAGGTQELTALKPRLLELRFSPDGKHLLAQDKSEITIITVHPLAVLFRIPAEEAEIAHFTPDSRQVVFLSSPIKVNPQTIAYKKSGAHVERWSIADQTRVASTTLPMLVCGTEELSPDGAVLVCLDLKSALRFVDVGSGQTIFEKKEFTWLFRHDPPLESGVPASTSGELGSATIDFSPDSNFVIVRPRNADGADLAFNVRQGSIVELSGQLKQLKHRTSVFIGPDRILLWNGVASNSDVARGVAKSKVIAFPSGKLLAEPKIPSGSSLFRATDPGFVIVRHFGEKTIFTLKGDEFLVGTRSSNRAAAAELSTALVIISNTPALDVLGHYYVAESAEDEVGLYEIGKGLQDSIVLHKK